jgi:hypothetical protein
MSSSNITGVVWKGIKSFFSFWKDFLVGDSPVLALGVLIILGVAYLLHDQPIYDPLAVVVMVLVLMTFAIWQKTRQQ